MMFDLRLRADDENSRRLLQNEIYGVLCKYLPKYETRGFNFHARAQRISEIVSDEFVIWINQNEQNGLATLEAE